MKMLTICLGVIVWIMAHPCGHAEDVTTDDAAQVREANSACLDCHAADPSGPPDHPQANASPARKRRVAPPIDAALLQSSVHAELACTECHGNAQAKWPHEKGVEAKSCPRCHKPFARTIQPEFERSVHALQSPDSFKCVSCHDPHSMRKAESLGSERRIAAHDNAMCLACHNSDQIYGAYTQTPRPDLLRSHSWQPNPSLHWSAVRCIDCHTPDKSGGTVSHQILPKEQAARLCVDCHSTEPSLLTRLYRHEVVEQRAAAVGFINSYILTQAYVLGVTRNRYLDWASLALLLTVLAAIAGHGLIRIATRSLRQGRK